MAYLGFHKLLYFERRVFLALNNVFSYYKKDTQRNQNKVININQWNKYCPLFLLFKCVTSKPDHIPWQNAKVCQTHCQRDTYHVYIYKRFLLSFWQFFLLTHCQGISKAVLLYCWKRHLRHFPAILSSSRLFFAFYFFEAPKFRC